MIRILIIRININIIKTNIVIMNIISSVAQLLFPFIFYTEMRNKHPVIYDEANYADAVFRYQDVRKILFNFKDFSLFIKRRSQNEIFFVYYDIFNISKRKIKTYLLKKTCFC